MRRTLFDAIAVTLAIHAAAQGRAPQNESIRQDDLRADLYFAEERATVSARSSLRVQRALRSPVVDAIAA